MMKALQIIFGFLALFLAILGAFLPVLPTTPFALLAIYLFSKSSEKLQQKVRKIPLISNSVKNWEERGAIGKGAKILAICMLILSLAFILITKGFPIWGNSLIIVGYALVATFILSRPS